MKFADVDFFDSEDGSHTLFAKEFGYTYHSKFGAIQESQHIFIESALRFKAAIQKKINVLEIGMGTGLNVYLTYLEALKRNLTIYYKAIEAYPVALEDAAKLNYVSQLKSEEHNTIFQNIHTCNWEEKIRLHRQFSLEKKLQLIENVNDTNLFDVIYFDAFAPDVQPQLWDTPLMEAMYATLKKDGILVTYCAKGQVRRNMKAAGFVIEKIPGPIGKREITRATKL